MFDFDIARIQIGLIGGNGCPPEETFQVFRLTGIAGFETIVLITPILFK
jgi:hypothetical protein